jgi:hypothetical protein
VNGIPALVLSNMEPPSTSKLKLHARKRVLYIAACFYKQAYVMRISICDCNEFGLSGCSYVK